MKPEWKGIALVFPGTNESPLIYRKCLLINYGITIKAKQNPISERTALNRSGLGWIRA
jgi:hypothetical protein